ncbi:MAG: hypothetical protein ABFD80_00910 [Acidobacteriota bacterium]
MESDQPESSDPRYHWEPVHVECHAGYREDETPRVVFLGGLEFPVAEVLTRKRLRDEATGRIAEAFECRLEAGWQVWLERSEEGSWRVRRSLCFFCGGK